MHMKRRFVAALSAVVLAMLLTGCSILPEDSPIILDGEVTSSSQAKSGKGSKKESSTASEASSEESTEESSSEESTEESSEESSEEIDESEEEWTELPDGGEGKPITERSTVEEKMQSYLTGEWKDETVVKRRNLAVMIPNSFYAAGGQDAPLYKPYGLSKASVIYEAPVEGNGPHGTFRGL